MEKRIPLDYYFMSIAKTVASRGTCDRKIVGAVIVTKDDKTILSTGYNGSLRGTRHCDEIGHDLEEGHCVRTIHAEANAIAQAARHGTKLDKSILYTTASPCLTCLKLAAQAGVHQIFYQEFYRDIRSIKYAKDAGIELIYLPEQEEK